MIKIREPKISDARNIAIVHIDSWLSTYRGIMPDERLDKLSYEKGEVKWINHIEQFKNENDIILLVAEDEIRELLEKILWLIIILEVIEVENIFGYRKMLTIIYQKGIRTNLIKDIMNIKKENKNARLE